MRGRIGKKSIASKLRFSFLILALLGVIIGTFGVVSLQLVGGSAEDLYNENILGLTTISNTFAEFQSVRNRLTQLLFVASDDNVADMVTSATQTVSELEEKREDSVNSDQVERSTNLLKEDIQTVDRGLEDYKAAVSLENSDSFAALIRDWNYYKNEITAILSNVESGKLNEAVSLMLESVELGDALETDFSNLISEAKADANAKRSNMDVVTTVAQLSVLVLVLFSLAASPFIARSLTDRIARPIQKISSAAEKLALGDLEIEIENSDMDEIVKLSNAFQSLIDSTKEQAKALERLADGDMTKDVAIRSEQDVIGKSISALVRKMRGLIMKIKTASYQVAEGANQISDSTYTLSSGASEQAGVVEELTASIEEISNHTSKNAESANEAKELAISAKSRALQGNSQMERLLSTMAEIRDSSEKVSKVIKFIEDIAFQTNILSLNAAVEASRAGAAGRGFAVVAEEVKNLAQRSAAAASETTDTIQVSIRKAAEGEKVAHDTAATFENIVKDIEKAAEAVSEIAAASADQALGIQQINQGILQVSNLAQANAATAEEEAAASQVLSEQANNLRDLLDDFTL